MNSHLDYDNLINSVFFKKGSIVFNSGISQPCFREDNLVVFDTTIPTLTKLNNLLKDRDNGVRHSMNIWPALYYSLMNGIIPNDTRRNIVTQWMSTLEVINQLECECLCSILLIGISGSYLGKHRHATTNKQTLTFQFDFPEFGNSDSRDNYINLYDDNDNLTHQLSQNKTNKSVFTIRNNVQHVAYFRNLRFYWIYDFEEYLNFDKINFGDFEFLNFEEIK